MYKPHYFALKVQMLFTDSAGMLLNLKLKLDMKLKLKLKLMPIMLNLSLLPPSPTMHPMFLSSEGNWRNAIANDPVFQVPYPSIRCLLKLLVSGLRILDLVKQA